MEVKKKEKKNEVETAERRRKVQGEKNDIHIHIPCLVVHDDKTHLCIIRFLLKLCEATTVKEAGNMMTAAGLVLYPLGLCPKS